VLIPTINDTVVDLSWQIPSLLCAVYGN